MTQTSSRLLVKSPGKLNLTFDIKGILPDGYHLVDTLMQAVSLEDELVFDIAPAEDFSLTLSAAVADNRQQSELIPLDGKNLISIAAQLFRNELGMLENLKINCTLRKHIPIAGGMGGGSSNAASTLCVLNKHFGNPLSETDIIELGAKIGADVPFFITGGTQLGTNKGEQLSPVRVGAKTWYVIISPLNYYLSTPAVYRSYDQLASKSSGGRAPNLVEALKFLKLGDSECAKEHFANVFEPTVFAEHLALKQLAERISQVSEKRVHLTGSGPTLFMIAKDEESAQQLSKLIGEEINAVAQPELGAEQFLKVACWPAHSIDRGVIATSCAPKSNFQEAGQ